MQRPGRVRTPVLDRTPADGARDLVHVGVNEKVHESTKLAAVFDALISAGFSAGFPAAEILRGIDVHPERVHSPKTGISLKQLTTACQNAIRLSTAAALSCLLAGPAMARPVIAYPDHYARSIYCATIEPGNPYSPVHDYEAWSGWRGRGG